MSRVGKHPVVVPDGVDVAISGRLIKAKGKLGELELEAPEAVTISQQDGQLLVKPADASRLARSLWGTIRSRLQNMVTGVSSGFTRELEITGVGYRASVQGDALNLQLGYSHEINYPIPQDIQIACGRPTAITVSGKDKQQVGQVAAEIRAFRPPEPYKGKGIRYREEQILRKEGKKK